jgi:DNA-binding response OmpR family regulator
MKRRVLIVGQERDFVEKIHRQIENHAELLVVCAGSSNDGLELALQLKPHLILIDTTLNSRLSHALCRRLHRNWETREIPILLLLEAESTEGEALVLKLGVEDYIRKPVVTEELVSKIRAVTRRRAADSSGNKGFDDGQLFLDFDAYMVRVDGHELKLTLKEFSLSSFLAGTEGESSLEINFSRLFGNATIFVRAGRCMFTCGGFERS